MMVVPTIHSPVRCVFSLPMAVLLRFSWALLFMFSGVSEGAPKTFPNFVLPTTAGGEFRFGTDSDTRWYVVCFLGTECPLAQQYGPRLANLAEQYSTRHVQFVGVYSNRQDSLEEVRDYASRHQLRFPMAKDYDHQAATYFDASRTPEVVLIDAQMQVLYQGRIDNQFQPGIARPAATQHDLREALEAVVQGKPVSISKTEAVGCLIGRDKPLATEGELTYCRDIAKILHDRCNECHRAGEIGPFALTDYEEVVGWGDMMVEVVDQGRMPPWHANPLYGKFANARQMPADEQQKLRKWVEAGMPFGNITELPKLVQSAADTQRDTAPDAEFAMSEKPYKIPAEGTIDYQYFVVDPGFTEDKWVSAAEVIPGDRGVVHHAIVFIRPPDGNEPRGVNWLTAFVPGQRPTVFPPGHARHIPAGSRFAFQMHYTPNGTATEDITRVQMQFVEESAVTHEVFTLSAVDQEFEIPPHAGDFTVPMHLNHLPRGGRLLGLAPHMHLRGKSFQLTGRQSGGSAVLLDVPRYDFNWQHFYLFAEPLVLDEFESFECRVGFDNSANNPANPDPTQRVTWGDQTWEEMAIAFFEVAQERTPQPSRTPSGPAEPLMPTAIRIENHRVTAFVDDFFQRFDRNGNGRVERDETPNAFRRFGFQEFDQNGDDILERHEVMQAADVRL